MAALRTHLRATAPESSVDHHPTTAEEAEAWRYTMTKCNLYANRDVDVAQANRIAVKYLTNLLLRRVRTLRTLRATAAVTAPTAAPSLERELQARVHTRVAAQRAELARRGNPRLRGRSHPLPSRMSPQEGADEFAIRLRRASCGDKSSSTW